jgi:hypothetical protein
MDFTADLMWDGATRDHDAESLELARTAALLDADAMVGPLVFQASDAGDLGHRLALAEPHLQAIAERRGYPAEELTADLTRRWQLLASARTAQAQQAAASRKVTAAQEAAMDQAVASLAAMAARENPLVPMSECLRLATEAVQKHADAFPLAYESWGGTGDGPFMDRAKHWKPPSMKGGGGSAAVDPGANGGDSTFDEVNRRLDQAENRVNSMSGGASPSGPSGPASPTASLDAMAAGFMNRVRDWWRGDSAAQHQAPAPSATPAPAASSEGHVAPYDPTGWHGNAPARHAEDAADAATERAHDQAGRREFDDIMRGLNDSQTEMNHKWDTPAADRFESPSERADSLEHGNNHRFNDMERRLNEAGAPSGGHSHHPAPASFSHADSGGASSGQQHLPTDPAPSFSHPSTPDTTRQRQDWAYGGHFQYGT